MSDFEFREPAVVSEELRMLRDQARRFVKDVVEPHGEQWERDGLVPRSIFRELGDLGLLVAVGMPLTRHPPHRSVRAVLPHTAPASGDDGETARWARGGGYAVAGARHRESV